MEIQKVTFVATPLLIIFAHPGLEDTVEFKLAYLIHHWRYSFHILHKDWSFVDKGFQIKRIDTGTFR